MWMKLILLLIATVCTAAGFVQKRSSVLTDESKKILDIFDFSNFDKQEALSYIDRQRFENLIRGKRSKWNLKQNMLSSNSSFGDNDNYSKSANNIEYSEGEFLANDEKIKLNFGNDLEESRGEKFPPSQIRPAKHMIRRARNAKQLENTKNKEEKDSGGHKDGNDSSLEVKDNRDDEDHHNEKQRGKKRKKKKRHHWSKWSEWSRCSVTCGRGRRIRSRRCIAKSCASGEIEMGEKTCQLPACSLFDKLFSFLT